VLALAFVVPIIVIVLFAKLATSGRTYDEDARSPEAVAKRIKPVAEVNMGAAGPADTGSRPTRSSRNGGRRARGASGRGQTGRQEVYETTCITCHGSGVANAPKFGDKKAWAMHLMHGVEHLYQNALKGTGAMPPRGGNLTLSERK